MRSDPGACDESSAAAGLDAEDGKDAISAMDSADQVLSSAPIVNDGNSSLECGLEEMKEEVTTIEDGLSRDNNSLESVVKIIEDGSDRDNNSFEEIKEEVTTIVDGLNRDDDTLEEIKEEVTTIEDSSVEEIKEEDHDGFNRDDNSIEKINEEIDGLNTEEMKNMDSPKRKRKRDEPGEMDFEATLMGDGEQEQAKVVEKEAFAAVSVGLKQDELSPCERVRFKDVMKRKSRVQEYLECRNFILKEWTKDVKRLLLVTDCGVSATPQPNEPPRDTLIRDIHEFLDDHAYINTGIVKRVKPGEQETNVENPSERESEAVPMEIDACPSDQSSTRKSGKRKEIVVIGAGPSGLAAARHMQRMNFDVTVLEARNRVGGRVCTDCSTFSVPVDLGASIITGTEADQDRRADPSTLICKQLGLELNKLRMDCPLYDSVTGGKVPKDLDSALDQKLNTLLDDTLALVAQNGEEALQMSLEEGLEQALMKRKGFKCVKTEADQDVKDPDMTVADMAQAQISELTESASALDSPGLERRVMDWHFANLEYGCAAPLSKVSLPYWSQDDQYGGFAGPHCMIKGGYGILMESLAEGIDVKLGKVVTEVSYTAKVVHNKTGKKKQVRVKTEDGELYLCDAVLLTVPLGCLKAQAIRFVPQLPSWKTGAINRLGFGVLNKVVLEFDTVFWDESVDYFGVAGDDTESRGRCFMFWNLLNTCGAPVLIALVVGKAALDDTMNDHIFLVSYAVKTLRKLYGSRVPEPKMSKVTDWGNDQFSRGAYSYVAVGASGEDYDIIGRPLEDCLFFAGEATCKEHPDTVGGAIMSGLKEAVRILDILEDRGDLIEEAEEMAALQRQPENERNEVRDMQTRIQAAEYAINRHKEEGLNEQVFTKEDLLKDMFRNAKTGAGRLFLAKEILGLSASSVKAFVGTKSGLSILNSWILDSMGRDSTQLLRLCIRLLLTVGTDMLAVRLSGIGKTVKDKVGQHSSRDIRALAGQLVTMWCELYRREKVLLKQYKKNVVKKATKDDESTPVNSSAPAYSSSQSQGHIAEQVTSRHEQKSGASSSEEYQEEMVISESEAAAIAQAEACQAAALAAAEAYANAEAQRTKLPSPPKIMSFHKFAKREKDVHVEKKHKTKRSNSLPANIGLHKDPNGSSSTAKTSNAVTEDKREDPREIEEMVKAEDKKVVTEVVKVEEVKEVIKTEDNKVLSTPEQVKKALTEYVVQLLTPLYKTKKIQKDAFKMIAKKTTVKVMEKDGVHTDMCISDYLNAKRKSKIRQLVDMFVEKHLAEAKQAT